LPAKSPPYTTLNGYGIYLFQFRFPKAVREHCPSLQVLFRRSLHTRCKRVAAERARRWCVIMNELAKRFFTDPAAYARAVELLGRYEEVENLNWESVEDYLSGLDEGETALLDTALSHRKAVQFQQSHQSLLEKVALLEKTVEALTNAQPSALPTRSILNKMDAGGVAGGICPSSSEPSLINPPPASPSPSSISIQKPDEDDLLLVEVGQKFVDYKRRLVTPGTLTSIRSKIDLFLKILTENNNNHPLRISDLSAPKMRTFRDVLLTVPSKRGGLPKDLTIKEMLRMNLKPISAKTVKDTTVVIGEFLTWMETEGYPITTGLKGILSSVKSPKKKDAKNRYRFLASIFSVCSKLKRI
jgi:hypothetical protein